MPCSLAKLCTPLRAFCTLALLALRLCRACEAEVHTHLVHFYLLPCLRSDIKTYILPARRRYVVPADASMSRAYRLFRTMGLRHMFVGPPQQKVWSRTLSLNLSCRACYDAACGLIHRLGRGLLWQRLIAPACRINTATRTSCEHFCHCHWSAMSGRRSANHALLLKQLTNVKAVPRPSVWLLFENFGHRTMVS